jgi:hypothetical protein
VGEGYGRPYFNVGQGSAFRRARGDRAGMCGLAKLPTIWCTFYAVVSITSFTHCSLDSRPILPASSNAGMVMNGAEARDPNAALAAAAQPAAAAATSTSPNSVDAGTQTGIGSIGVPAQTPASKPSAPDPNDADAGEPGSAQPSGQPSGQPTTQAPVQPQGPAAPTDSAAANSCSRDTLRKRAAAYLQAMNTGDLQPLNLHPKARYTENGETQMFGLGQWLSRPKTEFARNVLDESHCTAVVVAVLGEALQRNIYGVRLRYVEDQLLEAEAQVVWRNVSYYDPDSLIPAGTDPWIEPVAAPARMTRDALIHLAERYFDSSTDTSLLPAHAPDCRRRQNGALLSGSGSCGVAAGNERFEQRRFPVIDEPNGIVTAIVYYRNYVGMYLFKAQSDTIQNIDVVGGAAADGTGW